MKENIVNVLSKIIILVAIFFVGFYVGGLNTETAPSVQEISEEVRDEEAVSVMIDYGNGTLNIFEDIAITPKNSLFALLDAVTRENNIEFVYQDFGGDLGIFVNSINGVGEGRDDEWWQYWVNNKYGEVGVSSYIVKPGDIVEMKFIKGQL